MAVIVKYIVVRNGVEKMTFATKKEADAHDKMLDIADNLYEFLETMNIGLDETQIENISLVFAKNREKIISILRGIKSKVKKSSTGTKDIKSKKTISSGETTDNVSELQAVLDRKTTTAAKKTGTRRNKK